jgi:hypothetical protein
VQEMLELFGVDAAKELTLKPLEFLVTDGRVSYAKDWTWTIAGAPTSFAGSVGLDRTLALQWKVPVTDALVARYGFLDSLRGETVTLPIKGTVTRPSLDVKGALKDLALKAAGRGILEGLGGEEAREGEEEKGLGETLRERLGEEVGIGGTGEDPAKLLADADRLWDAGQKVEAAALYSKIREEHKLSLVYTLNRDRIKERAKYKPQ